MPENESAKVGFGAGVGSFAGAALALFLAGQKAGAAGQFTLDDATRNAIMAIMQDAEQAVSLLQAIAASLGTTSLRNPTSWKGFTVFLQTANKAQQFPAYPIPYKFKVGLVALPTNKGTLYIADTTGNTTTPSTRFSLIKGQAVNLEIDDTSLIWLNGDSAGDGVEVAVEIRSQ